MHNHVHDSLLFSYFNVIYWHEHAAFQSVGVRSTFSFFLYFSPLSTFLIEGVLGSMSTKFVQKLRELNKGKHN